MTHLKPYSPPLDTPSGWSPVSHITPMGTLALSPSKVDWLVVGAGFTGLAAARRLAELKPDDQILLVDAKPIGWGSSGRNSGFVIDLPHKFDLDVPDKEKLQKIISLNRSAIDELEGLIDTHNIKCDWSKSGKLQGAVKKRGTGMMNKFKKALDLVGEPYEELDRDGCRDIIGTDYYSGAVFTPGSVLVNPFTLVRGLAENLPENVILMDDCCVKSYENRSDGIKVTIKKTTTGEVFETNAPNMILAVDPYTSEFGYLKNRVLPLLTFASITRPLTQKEISAFTGKLDWGLTPADAGGTTLRMTVDGRILLRNQYAIAPKYQADDHMLARVRVKQREGFEKRYPNLDHVPFESTWGGVCGLSANHVSFFGKLANNVYSASCYNGVGLAKGTISGKLLAEYATGYKSNSLEDIIELSGMPSLIPPEPLRSIGVTTRLKVAEWQSKEEI